VAATSIAGPSLSDKSQDTVKLGAGVIATMSALVLGLRVSSAKNSYDVASANVAQIGARFIELDELLAEYGPETMPLREQLKTILAGRIELLWHPQANALSVLLTNERSKTTATLQNSLSALVPASEVQKCFFNEFSLVPRYAKGSSGIDGLHGVSPSDLATTCSTPYYRVYYRAYFRREL
jgi:hypothetical protein